jgi:ATP synthase subunit 6
MLDKLIFFTQPLDQFEIVFFSYFNSLPIIGAIPINTGLIYLILIYLIIRSLFGLILINLKLIPYPLQIFVENLYNFVFGLVKQQINLNGYAYFPIIFSLFLFILFSNVIGMSFYSFTLTSHVIIAFTLSFSFFIAIVIIGIIIQKASFVNTFIPSGAPKILIPFLICIEIISYFSRPFSLGIRLFANLMSGHTLLAILASFGFSIAQKSIIIGILPFILILAVVCLEFMIAGLQAYVFTVLICIYLNDSIQGSH